MANETRIEHASETWLADSTVFEVNRIPAHSDHKCYAHDPQTNEWSDLRQSLDGEWRVEVVQASDIEFNEEPFVRENFDDSAFERIQVPGHLQMAGLMNNKYVNIQYPWDGHENPTEPNIPENNHVALYRKTFTMANRLADTKNAGGTVSIVFHGMATAIYVWVNGMFVGYGEDGFTPNEFDITEMLHDGENVVAVACYEYSSASWLEDQDFWASARTVPLGRAGRAAACAYREHADRIRLGSGVRQRLFGRGAHRAQRSRRGHDLGDVEGFRW